MPRRPARPSAAPRQDNEARSHAVDLRPVDASSDVPGDAPGDAGGARPLPTERDESTALPPGDTALLGAYALGALQPEERAAVEERLAASPALQDELRRLIPVAALLREGGEPVPRRATDGGRGDTPEPTPSRHEPSSGSRSDASSGRLGLSPRHPARSGGSLPPRLSDAPPGSGEAAPLPGDDPAIAAPSADDPDIEVSQPVEDVEEVELADPMLPTVRVEAALGSLSSRPSGRHRARTVATAPRAPRPARAAPTVGSWPLSWIAAGLATVVAVAAVLWALAMVDRLAARQGEVDALRREQAQLRARGDAAVVALGPGEGGPAVADGVVVLVPSEASAIVRAGGLPASAEGRVYQLWFQDGPDDPWRVGPVFRVGEGGSVLTELAVAAPAFARVAISDEPAPGSAAPTGAFVLDGMIAAAND